MADRYFNPFAAIDISVPDFKFLYVEHWNAKNLANGLIECNLPIDSVSLYELVALFMPVTSLDSSSAVLAVRTFFFGLQPFWLLGLSGNFAEVTTRIKGDTPVFVIIKIVKQGHCRKPPASEP